MKKNEVMIVADYSNQETLTLEELCKICHITPELVTELIQYDIIVLQEPKAIALTQLRRAQTALRLRRDLEVNFAGAALILDLLEEMEALQRKMALLEKHYTK